MKLKRIMLITLLLLAVFTISTVSAADNMTDADDGILQETTDEIELGNAITDSSPQENVLGAKDNGTFTALQEKINNAQSGSTVTLENNYKYNEGFNANGITIEKSLTIDGAGHTIDANSKSRIFKLSASNIVLKNIKFTNGQKDNGGAIFISGNSITIDKCTFTNCHAASGGAIYARDVSQVNIVNSIFKKNEATRNGGAIWLIADNVNIENNEFEDNKAKNDGGAIYLSTFTERRTYKEWIPGHYEENRDITIFDYSQGMLVGSHHPKVWVDGYTKTTYKDVTVGSQVTIKNNTFDRNSMNKTGNAIIVKSTGAKISLNTNDKNSTYRSTIYVDSKDTTITGNKFELKPIPQPAHSTKTIRTGNKKTSSAGKATGTGTSKVLKTVKITAKKKTFKKSKKVKKYTATVKSDNKPVKNLKVTLKIKGKTYTAKTNSKGKVTFKIKKLTKKGTYKATVTFKGDGNYKKAVKKVKIKVK